MENAPQPVESTAPRGLVQAPVAPLDEDGVQVARVGTVVWLVAAAVTWAIDSSDWWFHTCLVGAAIGLFGVFYCQRRRRVRRTRS